MCGLSLGAPDLCAGLTLIIAVFLIVFAFQTKYDFTGIGPYLMVALLCLVLFAFVMIIFTDSRVSATLRLLSGPTSFESRELRRDFLEKLSFEPRAEKPSFGRKSDRTKPVPRRCDQVIM